MPSVPVTRDAIKKALRDHGPMTAPEIIETLGRPVEAINGSIRAARVKGTMHFRIIAYRRQLEHGGRQSPVYDVGPGADVAKPPPLGKKGHNEAQHRYAATRKAERRVFDAMRRGGKINPFMQLIRETK